MCSKLAKTFVLLLLAFQPVLFGAPKDVVRIGKLEFRVTKVESWAVIGDNFYGPSTYKDYEKVYVEIKNIGGFPVCSQLAASVEEYKGTEFWRSDPIKTDYQAEPSVNNLAPGKRARVYYTFELEPAKRNYVLVLEQPEDSQGCGKHRKDKRTFVSGERIVRIPVSPSKNSEKQIILQIQNSKQ